MGYSPWDHKESDMTEQQTNNSSTCIYDIIIFNLLGFHSAAINGKPSRDLEVEISVSRWQFLVGKAPPAPPVPLRDPFCPPLEVTPISNRRKLS